MTIKVISRSCSDLRRSNFKVIQISLCNTSKEGYGGVKYFGNILGQYIHLVSEKYWSKCICDIYSVQSDELQQSIKSQGLTCYRYGRYFGNLRQKVDATQIVFSLIFYGGWYTEE